MNTNMLVGRLREVKKLDDNTIVITLAITRPFRDANGDYKTDIIPCYLQGTLSSHLLENAKENDTIGVRGRLQYNKTLQFIAERITILGSRKDSD